MNKRTKQIPTDKADAINKERDEAINDATDQVVIDAINAKADRKLDEEYAANYTSTEGEDTKSESIDCPGFSPADRPPPDLISIESNDDVKLSIDDEVENSSKAMTDGMNKLLLDSIPDGIGIEDKVDLLLKMISIKNMLDGISEEETGVQSLVTKTILPDLMLAGLAGEQFMANETITTTVTFKGVEINVITQDGRIYFDIDNLSKYKDYLNQLKLNRQVEVVIEYASTLFHYLMITRKIDKDYADYITPLLKECNNLIESGAEISDDQKSMYDMLVVVIDKPEVVLDAVPEKMEKHFDLLLYKE